MTSTMKLSLLSSLLFLWIHPTAQFAEEPQKLKSQTVQINYFEGVHQDQKSHVNLELVLLPAGTITIKHDGKPDEQHRIKPVWMSRYETRWEQYDIFWQERDLKPGEIGHAIGRPGPPALPPGMGYDENGKEWTSPASKKYPADCIHFHAAQLYCAWLSKRTGKRFRLPTEAEWEYACRAGGPPVTFDIKSLRDIAWFNDNADGHAHPVGQKKPNAWGLYDMLGNVGEYVIRDPKDTKGLLAGGSWRDHAKDVHCGAREPYSPGWQKNDPQTPPSSAWLNWSVHHVGFRVVMEE